MTAVAMIAAAYFFPVQETIRHLLFWISSLGWAGYLAYFLIYVLASICLIPGSILTLGAGFLFGLAKGSLLVSLSSTAGAAAAFLVGRYFVRERMAARVGGNPRLESMDRAIGQEGWKIVLLLRLSPLFPFVLLNYAFSLTRVSFRSYVLASWLGMLPATLMYVYFGSLAQELAQIGGKSEQRSIAEWTLYGVGLLTTAAVALYITHLAKNALEKRL